MKPEWIGSKHFAPVVMGLSFALVILIPLHHIYTSEDGPGGRPREREPERGDPFLTKLCGRRGAIVAYRPWLEPKSSAP